MKSSEQQLTGFIELEFRDLNLFGCHVLNIKAFVRAHEDKWQSTVSFVAT